MADQSEQRTDISTGGGASVGGNVSAGHDFIGRDNITYIYEQTRIYERDALHQLPSIPEHFTGRAEQIQTLCDSVRANAATGTANAITSSIQGMGGVGKTALAIVVAHALTRDFPDAQLLIALGAHSPNILTPAQARDQVLRAFYPDARLPDDEPTLWNMYFTALHGKRVLLILDDVRDDGHVQPLLPPVGCAAIITSRRSLETGESLHLGRPPHRDAMALLQGICPRLSDAEADALASLCGDLPIALRVVGGYLKVYRTRKADDYARDVQADRVGRLNVNELFDFSYRALNEPERAALCALSVMLTDFNRVAGEAVIGEAAPANGQVLDELVALNLLDYDDKAERFRWHDLLRDFVSGKLGLNERAAAARARHAEHYTQVAKEAATLLDNGKALEGLSQFDAERPHIEAAYANLTQLDDPWLLGNLVGWVGGSLAELRFHPRQRIEWLEAQVKVTQRIQDRAAEGRALNNLGLAYAALGDARKAIAFYEQRIVIARETGDRRGEARALNNLGNAYADLGDTGKAIEFYERRLVIAREIGDRRGEDSALNNLGEAHEQLNEISLALQYAERAVEIAKQTESPRLASRQQQVERLRQKLQGRG